MPRTCNGTNGQQTSSGRAATNAANDGTNDISIDGLVQRAEEMRDSLRGLLTETVNLIGVLKIHRKQSKVVQSTLASLRQLETIEG